MTNYRSQKDLFFQKAYGLKGKRIEAGYGWPLEVDLQLIEFLKEIQKTLNTGKTLDLGCGEGRHAIYFAEKGFDSYGIDYIEIAIEEAKQKALEKGVSVNFQAMNVLMLEFRDNFFDVVLDWSVLDHIKPKDWDTYVSDISRILKSGGYLILTEFGANDEWVTDKRKNFFESKSHYDHYFRMDEIEKLFGKDFKIIRTTETSIDTKPKHLMLNVLLKKK